MANIQYQIMIVFRVRLEQRKPRKIYLRIYLNYIFHEFV